MDEVPLDGIDRQVMGHVGREVLGAVRLGALVNGTLFCADEVDMVLTRSLRKESDR